MNAKKAGRNTVVLLGVGHTNAHILRMWKMHPVHNAQLVCVSNFPLATYSGMLPGVLAGQYPVEDMEIDLVRLCNSAGSRLILDEVESLDTAQRQLIFKNRPPLAYDALSIGVGSRPSFDGVKVEAENNLIAVKPMQTFLDRLRNRVDELKPGETPLQILVVGGGIGSIEIAFCLNQRLKSDDEWWASGNAPGRKPFELTIVTGSQRVGSGLLPSTQDKVAAQLAARDIKSLTGGRVASVNGQGLVLTDGTRVPGDLIIWATTARAASDSRCACTGKGSAWIHFHPPYPANCFRRSCFCCR